jgi:hypothetical protein
MIQLEGSRGRVRVRLAAMPMGRDWNVSLAGGDREHIGAVALSQPRGPEGGSAPVTTSVLALRGHREDDLAKATAARLAQGLQATVCVACGIHVDGIAPEEVATVLALAGELTEALLERAGPGGKSTN